VLFVACFCHGFENLDGQFMIRLLVLPVKSLGILHQDEAARSSIAVGQCLPHQAVPFQPACLF